jgi:hypothetical protein
MAYKLGHFRGMPVFYHVQPDRIKGLKPGELTVVPLKPGETVAEALNNRNKEESPETKENE